MWLHRFVLAIRTGILLRRGNRSRRRRLAAELGTYRTEADLNDLCTLLESYPDGQTHEIREILNQQQMHRTWTRRS